MHDLTGFQRDLLVIVAGLDEPNGLEIKAEIEEYYQTDIRHGRLYPNLDKLVEMGFIEKGQHDQRTNKYLLRDRGRRELVQRRDWENQYVAEINAITT